MASKGCNFEQAPHSVGSVQESQALAEGRLSFRLLHSQLSSLFISPMCVPRVEQAGPPSWGSWAEHSRSQRYLFTVPGNKPSSEGQSVTRTRESSPRQCVKWAQTSLTDAGVSSDYRSQSLQLHSVLPCSHTDEALSRGPEPQRAGTSGGVRMQRSCCRAHPHSRVSRPAFGHKFHLETNNNNY